MFASHFGVEMMRTIKENGKEGVETALDTINDQNLLLRPGESWASRTELDAKIELVLSGLERRWPEV